MSLLGEEIYTGKVKKILLAGLYKGAVERVNLYFLSGVQASA